MNKKYDYIELLSELDVQQYRLFNICSINSTYFGNLIFNNIVQDCEINSAIFNRVYFTEWLNQIIDDSITRLESEVIKWIHDYPGFFDFYKGDWSVDSIINSVIQSWKNKPKTLRLNKLSMLYANYIRFLGTMNGQTFLYGTTAYNILDYEDQLSSEDTPYYSDMEHRIQNLIKCKKLVVSEVAKNGVEACVASAVWNSIFNTEGKYNLTKALNILKADPKMTRMSDMQMRRKLQKMKVLILESLLKDDKIETYFDSDYTISMDGTNFTLKSALEYYLVTTKADLDEKKPVFTECPKILNGHINISAFTRDEFRLTIEKYCIANGIQFSYHTNFYNGIAKLKIDANLKKHKTYKLWIYTGGGYRDFSTGTTGYVTEIIPKEYFDL